MTDTTSSNTRSSEMLAILGGGNIGTAIAEGFERSGTIPSSNIIITRRQIQPIEHMGQRGFIVQQDNRDAVRRADRVIIAVRPGQLMDLLAEIADELDPERHVIISVVSDVTIAEIRETTGAGPAIIRAMPNLAVAINESMTCLTGENDRPESIATAQELFDILGNTLVISEELMVPATALCACGVAFFFRAIRAASQGGIQIGFHADDAIKIAAQTAKGAADLLLIADRHPEAEIDKVTTPRGCTIAGLNEMEHQGFSSSMIKGIITSHDKAAQLFDKNHE